EVVGDAPADHPSADDEDVPAHRERSKPPLRRRRNPHRGFRACSRSPGALHRTVTARLRRHPGQSANQDAGRRKSGCYRVAVRAPLGSLVGSLLVATVVLAACRTVEDMQRDYAKKITPHGVESAPVADTSPEKPLRPMKVRVWVD